MNQLNSIFKQWPVLLMCMMMVSPLSLSAKVKIGDLYYELDEVNKTATVTYEMVVTYADVIGWGDSSKKNYPYLEELSIPSSVTYQDEEYIVTAIGAKAFQCAMTLKGELKLPSTITVIDNSAFACCKFEGDLIIPETVTKIGGYAFSSCSYFNGKLVLPSTLKRIEYNTFEGCIGLTGTLDIPEGVTEIGGSAFSNCRGLTGDLVIPESVVSIGRYAFFGCENLNGNLKLPKSLIRIEDYAFARCSKLKGSIIIPESVREIGAHAFEECRGFYGPLVLPESLEAIGESAFADCWYLFRDCDVPESTLIIPNSLTKIEANSFEKCGWLDRVIIGNSVEAICDNAFYGCYALSDIRISSSVKSIGNNAFAGTGNMLQVVCQSSVPPVIEPESTVFPEDIDNAVLAVPYGCENDYKEAEGWKAFKYYAEAPSEIFFYKAPINIKVGEWKPLSCWMDGGVSGYFGYSSDSDIVILNSPYEGCVTGIKPGTAIVKVFFDSEVYNFCEVNVTEESGIKNVEADSGSGVKVSVVGNIVKIAGATIGDLCNVYRIDGKLVQSIRISDTEKETLPMSSGLYIVKVGNSAHKVSVL